jgi:hypothetical protein
MTAPTPKPTLPRVLGEIAFMITMFVGILLGIREGFALVIPAGSCVGTPVEPLIYVLSLVFFMHFAFPENKPGWRPRLRFGAALLLAGFAAVLAARLAAGCTPLTDWFPDGRFIVEALILNAILIPLAHLHADFIEPRWSRAMGDGGAGAGGDGGKS